MPNLTTAFCEGFDELLELVGWSPDMRKLAAYGLERYVPPKDFPDTPLGLAAGAALPLLHNNLIQLADIGDELLLEEKRMKQQEPLRQRFLIPQRRA